MWGGRGVMADEPIDLSEYVRDELAPDVVREVIDSLPSFPITIKGYWPCKLCGGDHAPDEFCPRNN